MLKGVCVWGGVSTQNSIFRKISPKNESRLPVSSEHVSLEVATLSSQVKKLNKLKSQQYYLDFERSKVTVFP